MVTQTSIGKINGLRPTLGTHLLNLRSNSGIAIESTRCGHEEDCVRSIAVPTVHESIKELKMESCICFMFRKYLVVTDVPDIRCKYYHYLPIEFAQHCG